ncbi:N-acetyltransferase san like protein [Verticillium longisporum]|uniref:N-acetyltransferase san like protein n=1 Tax=Verticillium longisporum TaxID=100787 RepID=A0A8I3ANX5_VERLO|nr:N-acetyltransferase san like protein [Verticillium longisporum]
MSLPSSSSKPSQTTIKSFFQPRQPKYAAPPSQPQPLPKGLSYEAPPLPPSLTFSSQPNPASATAQTAIATPRPSSQTGTQTQTQQRPVEIPAEAAIRTLSASDIQALRRINALLLPVAYPDSFYTAALSSPFSRAITWSDPAAAAQDQDGASSPSPAEPKLIGGLVARLEPLTATAQALYIQSLALLSPYRAHGLATAALADLLAAPELAALAVTTVYAHVWTENADAIAWYAARGFAQDPRVQERYYHKLRPDTAYVVTRDLAAPLPSRPAMGNASSAPAPSVTAAVANLAQPSPPSSSQETAAATATAVGSVPAPPPPPASDVAASQTRPGPPQSRGLSFQNKRAETEWNDLPSDMAPGLLAPPSRASSGPGSEASSRSSSTVRKKKDRSYPAAAFQS